MLCVVVTLKTNFHLGFYGLKKKKTLPTYVYLFPRFSDEREGGGNGGDLSDQSPFIIVVAM